jgi:hypothetical protein
MTTTKYTLLALAALPLPLLAGCPGVFGCGGYNGGGDAVYQRGTDSLIECGNGGFVLMTAAATTEGRMDGTDGVGPNGGLAFSQTENEDETLSIPALGAGSWQNADLDQVTLDHANTMCTALTTRGWWTAPIDSVPQVTELANAAHRLVLCPSDTFYLADATDTFTGNFTLQAGSLDATTNPDAIHLQPIAVGGQLDISGAFTSSDLGAPATATWQTVPADDGAITFCTNGAHPLPESN